MPTYAISAAAGRITVPQRAAIATALTTIHHEEARAPKYLVQVIFYDVAPSSHFIGGELAPAGQIWVRADIRAGRTETQKSRMLERILKDTCRLTDAREEEVYVYICDLPAQNIIEYGRILPQPGEEAAWLETLPASLQERLRRIG